MKISELKAGDIMFTMLNQKPPALHTQLYIGKAQFPETALHAVDGDKFSKLMATGLKPGNETLVYRCGRADLVSKAVQYGFRWTQYQTPYDQERKNLKEGYRNYIAATGKDSDIPQLMAQLFRERGKFRAIKYAARRSEILCYPNEDGNSRGLTCTMFGILCYQVAGISKSVWKTRELFPGCNMVRVSDKKLTPADIEILKKMVQAGKVNSMDCTQYLSYVQTLQSGNEYQIDWDLAARDPSKRPASPRLPGYQYIPSLLCWHSNTPINAFSFEHAMTPGLMVDAKIATSEQWRLCLEKDSKNWTNMGYLDESEKPTFDPQYKAKLDAQTKDAERWRGYYAPRSPQVFNRT